jgi:purine-binding chemotaxis protein CheW
MSASSEIRQFCTFYLDAELFGIEVLQVQEVMRHPVTTPVPLATDAVSGLMNLRGSIVSCIDLRRRFGMCVAPAELEPVQVVIQIDNGLVSFQVDRIGEVVEITDASLEAPPATLKGEARKLIDGVYKLKNLLLLVVNANKVLEWEEIHK